MVKKPTKKTEQSFQRNLRMLKAAFGFSTKEIHLRSGVSERMIDYLLAGERSPTEETANQIAPVFGLSGWQMLYPNLTTDLAQRGKLDRLIEDYGNANAEGKEHIEMVAHREAKYSA